VDFFHLLPPEGAKILLALFLSFLMGLEREERRNRGRTLLLRRSAHLPFDRTHRLRHVPFFREGRSCR